ncbi:DUF4180 domain-containing protein [Nonomuraea cavernae]|uniref:DUF4180 domain-containing protein n=1 Tax=Nonomuraea cavernae TaxID=2045107 RepID=A0A917YQI1_9ACTN|nr:DUF4180 domain-containing protein [Nonomuraea cavernae]MCA2184541.1 DUF4180 domain-containing protein [Nonomuraea cavernae]GGO63478.1 hypothetical protein GCM10012289_10630 [Nonomuraea cavernae]
MNTPPDDPPARLTYGQVLLCEPEGTPLREERDALDLIGEAGHQGARWVAIPAGRLHDDFYRLRTRVAGDLVQKFANYRIGVAIVGDISRHTAASTALQDWVRESNRGAQIWFVDDLDELGRRLEERSPGR